MVLNVMILEREENQSTRREASKAQERSTRNSTHMSGHPMGGIDKTWPGFFSSERYNALIVCATRASPRQMRPEAIAALVAFKSSVLVLLEFTGSTWQILRRLPLHRQICSLERKIQSELFH